MKWIEGYSSPPFKRSELELLERMVERDGHGLLIRAMRMAREVWLRVTSREFCDCFWVPQLRRWVAGTGVLINSNADGGGWKCRLLDPVERTRWQICSLGYETGRG